MSSWHPYIGKWLVLLLSLFSLALKWLNRTLVTHFKFFLSKEKVYGGKWCLFYFIKKKKKKMYYVLLCKHWKISSHLWETCSCFLSCCRFGQWAITWLRIRFLCSLSPSFSLFTLSPNRKLKATLVWSHSCCSKTSSSTNFACWLLWPCVLRVLVFLISYSFKFMLNYCGRE